MKKRNLAAIGMAGIMTVAMSMPVLAFDGTETNTSAGTATVELEEPVSYTVTIPSTVDLKQQGFSFAPTSVTGKLAENKKVSISLQELSADGKLTLNAGGRATTIIFEKASAGITDKIIAEYGNTTDGLGIEADSAFTVPSVNVPSGANLPAGEYTATVTYSVTYGD